MTNRKLDGLGWESQSSANGAQPGSSQSPDSTTADPPERGALAVHAA